MATIRVNDDWRIKSDAHQWCVERFHGIVKSGKRAGEEDWRGVLFCSTLGKAAAALAERQIRTADVEGMAAVMDEWKRITEEIDAALRYEAA